MQPNFTITKELSQGRKLMRK